MSTATSLSLLIDYHLIRFYKGLTLKEQPISLIAEESSALSSVQLPSPASSSASTSSVSELEPTKKRAKIQVIHEDDDEDVDMITPIKSTSETNALSSHEDHQFKQANNSYIYCPEAHHLSTNNEDEQESNSKEFELPIISLLLPSVSLNGILPEINNHIDNPEQTLLEVSCQILNINVYPFYPDVSSGRLPSIAIGSL